MSKLITEILDFSDFQKIYNDIDNTKSIATIFKYRNDINISNTIEVNIPKSNKQNINFKNSNQIAVIGSGNFTQARVIPSLKN